ncbi:pseudouridine synthase [Porphyromonas sp. COT-239 OH1446]|uniref:pseudouridine synthase n=1 Tax=Porphyromonas sp. COT-239 OH1446 TaxID=1515613 RepID=UPI0009DFCD41|nr:pseudouridine synthase [Porphyromonas sp. COT-239 OH1446]
MSTAEEKDLSSQSKPTTAESAGATPRRRMPVASSDGSQQAQLHDHAPNRRKRIRISTSESANPLGRGLSRRFNSNRPSGQEDRRPAFSREQAYEPSHRGEGRYPQPSSDAPSYNRGELDERYQSQREEGNYSYTYSRTAPSPKKPSRGKKASPAQDNADKTKKKAKKKKSFTPPEPVKYQELLDPTTEIRLNKFLANAGVASRREADQLILKGEITVNGVVASELGMRVTPADEVVYQGKRVESEYKVYILLNKPKNCVTTSDDPECRLTVMDLVRNACSERIYPVGRLDRNTTGVLLITNDGELASKLTHPSYKKKKIYHVWLNKPVEMEHMQQIADGIELEDGPIHADAISYVKEDDLSQVGIEIHSGRNRIVRRIFEHLGYRVVKLDRVYFAGLTKKNLPRGRWRYLDEQEVNNLRMGAFE